MAQTTWSTPSKTQTTWSTPSKVSTIWVGPTVSFYLVTEAGDNLITEAEDKLLGTKGL